MLAQMTNVPDSGAVFVAMVELRLEANFWKEVQRSGDELKSIFANKILEKL